MSSFVLYVMALGASCLPFCLANCPTETGRPLDLNQFIGKWYMAAGTPVNGKTLSKCGTFNVRKTSAKTFAANYTAFRQNTPVSFNIEGVVSDSVTGNWQLMGSTKILGPFKHVVVSVDYDSYIVMVVCSENNSRYLPRQKFSMIWSRERSMADSLLEQLKTTLSSHICPDDILLADQVVSGETLPGEGEGCVPRVLQGIIGGLATTTLGE